MPKDHRQWRFIAVVSTPLIKWRRFRSWDGELASVHPVLTFADPATSVQQFEGTLCGCEGNELALGFVEDLLKEIGAIPFRIRSDSKSLDHAAAVISNNFTVVLQAVAREA